MRHFLSIADASSAEIFALLENARQLKQEKRNGQLRTDVAGKTLGLLFEKPSLRTRMSFEVAMRELGGWCSYLSPAEVGLGKRESVGDVARVMSRYVHVMALRTFTHRSLEQFAAAASIPVINALTDLSHPCQALADLFTIWEAKGQLTGLTLAYIGDGFNVAHSLLLAAARTGMNINVATPPSHRPSSVVVARAHDIARGTGSRITLSDTPRAALENADAVYTDVWTSMGQESEYEQRQAVFAMYQLNTELLGYARSDAIVLHDLPAHRGQEITDEVMDGPQSVIFEQAENRLHTQKALLLWLLGAAHS